MVSFSLYLSCALSVKGCLVSRKMKDPWTMGMVLVMTVFIRGVRGVWTWNPHDKQGHNFNGEAHDALCKVFQASAELWEASQTPGKKLDNGLETGLLQALNQTLFGSSRVGTEQPLDGMNVTLPKEYHATSHRGDWCGKCNHGNTDLHPGSSIPHDLMCLCTPGYYSMPFYVWQWNFWYVRWDYRETNFTLCGRQRAEMVQDQYQGWYYWYKGYGQNEGLQKSWNAVVLGCYNNRTKPRRTEGHNLEEKIKKLSVAMREFTTLLKQSGGHDRLGGFEGHHTPSDGSDETSLHVLYDTCDGKRKPWWKILNETLHKNHPHELVLNRTPTTLHAIGASLQDRTKGEEVRAESMEDQERTSAQGGNATWGHALNSTQHRNTTWRERYEQEYRPYIQHLRSHSDRPSAKILIPVFAAVLLI
ncbi:Variant surface glycoprotein [Trypanosoma congolense IL3000]|uniref:Variant surface glycoprotein n=2 Tax=Trypanosoma congolense (strain IL3000) TaxID=1068625 RepID=F9WJF1_TRYCI|nr:Variant surface glycoprotein [Trypanosoma congolense IL3000]